MRLIALYNVFDGEELLEGSIREVRPHVDGVAAFVQTLSNTGEWYDGGTRAATALKQAGLIDFIETFRPQLHLYPIENEAKKRLAAAEFGQRQGFTHFLHVDCDEFYDPAQFAAAKDLVERSGADGSVASIQTYFKKPEWELEGLDNYFVPFIHRYGGAVGAPVGEYPYKCDPTRVVQAERVITIPPETLVMHHFSWVRKDIGRKIRNSSMRASINKSDLMEDYERAQPGSCVRFFDKRIRAVGNPFGINVG